MTCKVYIFKVPSSTKADILRKQAYLALLVMFFCLACNHGEPGRVRLAVIEVHNDEDNLSKKIFVDWGLTDIEKLPNGSGWRFTIEDQELHGVTQQLFTFFHFAMKKLKRFSK